MLLGREDWDENNDPMMNEEETEEQELAGLGMSIKDDPNQDDEDTDLAPGLEDAGVKGEVSVKADDIVLDEAELAELEKELGSSDASEIV